ncbi:Myosin light chain kinase smooth muscle [Paragonimus heterotremus]|uniref:Myosin light chain kinase smooth muscle n=1 Tax=Paragonimus heterotremus TaxID=100268 RepID=A0A8J4WDE3_9TREM|nr:Myosin light chain kinase smooth muscle [Paragonimus heterotremus]
MLSGKFGEVKRCIERITGGHFAAKFIPIASKEDWQSIQNEIAIMNKLRHPRLIQLYDAYAYKDEVVMVLELITGGELFERIIDESFDLNETRCIRFMNEILQGVEYIHAQGVIHLDLKPENILCLSRTSFKIKIIDFGLARFYDNKEMCVLFGTPEFVSPEVISYEPVTPAADMWSVGVICYVMLSGLSPFMGDSQGETLANIMRVTYDFNYPEFDEISEGARDFIRKLLIKDPRKRMMASECLEHSWIKRKKQLKRKGTVSKKRLKHFVYRRKWQKAVNAIIALLRMGVVLHHEYTSENSVAQSIDTVPPTLKTSKEKFNQSDNPSTRSTTKITPKTEPLDKQTKSSNKSESVDNKRMKSSKPNEQSQHKENTIASIFGKMTAKRVTDEESSNVPKMPPSTNSRRPSILNRFSRREGSRDSKTNIRGSKTSLKKSSVSSEEESITNRSVKLKLGRESNIAEKSKKKICFTEETTELNTSKTEDKTNMKTDTLLKQSGKSVQPRLVKQPSTTRKLTTASSQPEPSDQIQPRGQAKSSPPIAEQSSTTNLERSPVKQPDVKVNLMNPERPTKKKIAPVTGGIAAKIGFFSNLPKDSNSRFRKS